MNGNWGVWDGVCTIVGLLNPFGIQEFGMFGGDCGEWDYSRRVRSQMRADVRMNWKGIALRYGHRYMPAFILSSVKCCTDHHIGSLFMIPAYQAGRNKRSATKAWVIHLGPEVANSLWPLMNMNPKIRLTMVDIATMPL